jgi:hypothetical protein
MQTGRCCDAGVRSRSACVCDCNALSSDRQIASGSALQHFPSLGSRLLQSHASCMRGALAGGGPSGLGVPRCHHEMVWISGLQPPQPSCSGVSRRAAGETTPGGNCAALSSWLHQTAPGCDAWLGLGGPLGSRCLGVA